MELRHLKYFVAVAQTGSVTQAAARCFIAQSALSAQLTRLESELGGDLFVRTSRGMRLTAAGEALRPRAEQLLALADELQSEMAAVQGGGVGQLRMGVVQGLPRSLDLIDLLTRFHGEHPRVELSVRTGASTDLTADVRDGALDVAIVAIRVTELPGSVTVTPLLDDPLVAVAAAGLFPAGAAVGVSELARRGAFIHYQRGSGLRASVAAAFARAGLDEAEVLFELDQITDMVRLASSGTGVTIVPASAATPAEITAGCVWALSDPLALHTLNAISAPGASAATAAMLGMLRAAGRSSV